MSNNFDDYLKRKWEEKQFPVDEQHRKEMLALLDSTDRRKGIFWWLGGLGLAIAIGSFVLLDSKEGKVNAPSEKVPSVVSKEETPVASNINEAKMSRASETNLSPESKGNSSGQFIGQKENNLRASKNFISKKSNAHSKIQSVNNGNIAKKHDSSPGLHVEGAKTTNNIFETAPILKPEEGVVIQNPSPAAVSKPVAVVVMSEEEYDKWILTQPAVRERNTDITAPVEILPVSDVMELNSGENFAISPSKKHLHPFSLFAEGGVAFIPEIINEYNAGYTLNAGAGVGFRLNSRLILSLSGGYLFQNGGFDFERASTVIQKDFGIRSNFNTLTPDKLHFIYSRIGLQYHLKRNIFSLYGGLQYLYGAQGTLVIRTVDQLASDQQHSQYTWLNTDGMQKLLWNGEIDYGYHLTPRFSIHGGIKYFFTALKKEDDVLHAEGYNWKGEFSSFTPTFTLKYQLNGKR